MMEAVGRRKAHWLFGAGSEKTFSGKRRPQEDMVTSAVFGSIRLMSPEDRSKAVELLLGRDAFEAAGLANNSDIEVEFWPRLTGPEGRRHVEPDILLKAAKSTVIVEVKWHAPLSNRQLEQQIQAVGEETVNAVVMLGAAGVEEVILGIPCFRRTWRDVSGDLQTRRGETNTPFGRWVVMMHAFLHETDLGRIFNGLPCPTQIEGIAYRFSKPGFSPWWASKPTLIEPTYFEFRRKS